MMWKQLRQYFFCCFSGVLVTVITPLPYDNRPVIFMEVDLLLDDKLTIIFEKLTLVNFVQKPESQNNCEGKKTDANQGGAKNTGALMDL